MSVVKRITLISLFIVLGFMTLGTVTYAWLSVSTTNMVDSLDLGAEADNYLELSLDGENFANTIDSAQVMRNLVGVKFKDVTTNDGENFRLISGDIARKNSQYISLDIWARSRNRSSNLIFLVDNDKNAKFDAIGSNTAVASKGYIWRPDNSFLYDVDQLVTPDDLIEVYAKDAIRISLVERSAQDFYGVTDLRTAEMLSKRIIDPSENEHRGFGKEYGQFDYYNRNNTLEKLELPSVIPLTYTEFTTFRKDNPNVAENQNTLVATLQDTDIPYDEGEYDFYKVAKFTINIWIEGWDADAFDAVLGDFVQIKLKFKLGRYYQ